MTTSLNKLEKKVIAVAASTAAQSLTAGVATYLDFATITEDNYGAVTAKTLSTDWNFVVPKSGMYDIEAQVITAAHTLVSAIKYELSIYVNGSKVAIIDKFQSQSTTALFEVFLKGIATLRLAKGDVVKIVGFTDSAVDINIATTALMNKVVIVKRETKIEEN